MNILDLFLFRAVCLGSVLSVGGHSALVPVPGLGMLCWWATSALGVLWWVAVCDGVELLVSPTYLMQMSYSDTRLFLSLLC